MISYYLRRIIPWLRWRLFRNSSALFLGSERARLLYGDKIVHHFASGLQHPEVFVSIEDRRLLSCAEVVHFDYPSEVPAYFPLSAAFEDKSAYQLKDVCVIPRHGALELRGGYFLAESITGFDLFMVDGMYESMMRMVSCDVDTPIFPFTTCFVYYHELIEIMTAALQARDWKPDVKFLIHPNRQRYIDGMLEFFGVERGRLIEAENPVMVKHCIFVPHPHQRSYASKADLEFLNDKIAERLVGVSGSRRIYISRRKTTSRSVANESDLEKALSTLGFEILFFEEMNFRDQMIAIRQASVVVAVHGSGLANLVAAREGTRVVEIISPEWRRSTFARLSVELDLDYQCVEALENEGMYYVDINSVLSKL